MTRDRRDDPANQDSAPRIAGRYKVERLLARGGMATVYLATHVDLNRSVALKVLRPPDDADQAADFADRFRLEAMTLASLDHAHIVTLHDFGEMEDGRWFLAMEFIDGKRLSDIIRQGPVEPHRAVHLLLQVCQALRYSHAMGVIHRDLKPSNLMIQLTSKGAEHVKVVDFGLVKLTDDEQSMTRAGLILGSPHCMSPEQVKGDDVDATADIYAVGVLLFRCVTGKYPFHGSNSTATMMAHLNKEVPSFYSIDPDMQVPEGLEAIVQRCLQKRPADRYASMDDLITALAGVIDAPPELYRTATMSIGTGPMALHTASQSLALPVEAALAKERERDRRYATGALLSAVLLGALGLGIGWAVVNNIRDAQKAPIRTPPAAAAITPRALPAPPKPAPVQAAPPAAVPEPAEPTPRPISRPPARPVATPSPRRPAPPAIKPRPTPSPAPTIVPTPAPAIVAPTPTPAAKPDGYKGLPEDW